MKFQTLILDLKIIPSYARKREKEVGMYVTGPGRVLVDL